MIPTGRNSKNADKVPRDIDSSEESNSSESPDKSQKSNADVKQKRPPKEKEVRVAPNSTSYKKEESTDPAFRPSSKREAFQRKVKRETEIGTQGRHRQSENDFKGNYPELTPLQKAQRKKDFENKPASLDPVKLIEQANSARGHLRVQVKDKKDVKVLVDVLNANPSIRSLDLVCDFGGKSTDLGALTRTELHALVVHAIGVNKVELLDQANWPDTDSFRSILSACKNVEVLNLKECLLTEKDWYSLAEQMRGALKLRRLEFGGGIKLSQSALEKICSAIASKNSSLRELVIDDLSMNQFSFENLSKAVKKHGNFSLLKLQNIYAAVIMGNFAEIDLMFDICASNPKLQYFSLAGTVFKPQDADENFGLLPNIGNRDVSARALNFRKHACLRVLDLTGCCLDHADMAEIAAACDGHAALIEIGIEGNKISDSDRDKINATTEPNLQRLKVQATAAYDLLVTHASGKIDVWPEELSRVLVENTPAEILPNIAAVVAPGSGPSAQGPTPTNTRSPKNSSGGSTQSGSSKKQ